MSTRKTIHACWILAAVLALCVCSGCAVVRLADGEILYGARPVAETEAATAFDVEFDPDEYVESAWESRVLPEFVENAAPLNDVINLLNQDFDMACQQYGILSNDKGSWVFVVTGSGTLREVNRESRNGLAIVEAGGEGAPYDVLLQIGPVYKGASLRDALPFIKFSDFKNQVAFSSISSALNRKVDADVIPAAELENNVGKTIAFTGAFSLVNGDGDIIVTPITLTAGG